MTTPNYISQLKLNLDSYIQLLINISTQMSNTHIKLIMQNPWLSSKTYSIHTCPYFQFLKKEKSKTNKKPPENLKIFLFPLFPYVLHPFYPIRKPYWLHLQNISGTLSLLTQYLLWYHLGPIYYHLLSSFLQMPPN